MDMESIYLRKANLKDAPAIKECASSAYTPYISVIGTEPSPLKENYENLIKLQRIHVLTKANSVVGFIVCFPGDGHLLVDNIAIHPDFQGHYLSAWFLRFAEQTAIDLGFSKIRLYTNINMRRNIRLYKMAGFFEIFRREEKGFHRVYMEKKIESAP